MQKPEFDSQDFQFVLHSIEHALTSKHSLPEILFYGSIFNFKGDDLTFNFKNHKTSQIGMQKV